MDPIHSFHNFIFPFRWNTKGMEDKTFSEQVSLRNLRFTDNPNWERSVAPSKEEERIDLYNERNYYYEFVHDALYDNGQDDSLIRHFERREPRAGMVRYHISCKPEPDQDEKVYELIVSAINLNFFSTGVGVLSFYTHNNRYEQPEDILTINQFGRRVFPPFLSDDKSCNEVAKSLEITGLHSDHRYFEDFSRYSGMAGSNIPASFITEMIREVADNIDINPVIDDRMFVLSWYKNDTWARILSQNSSYLKYPHWYEYVFVDKYNGITCQNDDLQKELIQKATYTRWQKYGTLYGISRYSLVCLTTSDCPSYIPRYFETEYARMVELILVQKASVLRFSAEVTNISNLSGKKHIGSKVNALYKEYIRFVNQIHFREVSPQDQGIELYTLLYETMNLKDQVEKLDQEIEELYNFITLREDRKSNHTMSQLSWIATIALPITVMTGIFGMNNVTFGSAEFAEDNGRWFNYFGNQFLLTFILLILVIILTMIITQKRNNK